MDKKDRTLEELFDGRPEALELFHLIRRYVESLGPVKIDVTKTQVSFGAANKFAWVWLPQLWIKKRPSNSVTLTFDVGHRIEDDRIAQAVEPRPGRWTHHVIIDSEDDLDSKVREWLREAYRFGQSRQRAAHQ